MARVILLLVALLAACGPRRKDVPPPSWESQANIGCTGAQMRRVTAALDQAAKTATECLVKKGLNPGLGETMLSILEGGIYYDCVQNIVNFGGRTFLKNGYTHVWFDSNEILPHDPGDMARVAFHEALHAADNDEEALDLAFREGPHNVSGSDPDPVRACEFVCTGHIREPGALDGWIAWHEELAGPLPENKDWKCRSARCPLERKLAWICQNPFDAMERTKPFQAKMKWSLCAARALRGPGAGETAAVPLAREIMRLPVQAPTEGQRRLEADLGLLQDAGRLGSCGARPIR